MTNCLFIMHSFGGGAEAVTCLLLQHLDKSKIMPVVACTRYIPELLDCLPVGSICIMPQGPSFIAALRALWRIYKVAGKSDCVVGSLELQSIFWAALFAPGKALAWLHKDLVAYLATKKKWYQRLYTTLCGWAFSRCHTVVGVSQGAAANAQRLFPHLRAKICHIDNPIRVEYIRRQAEHPLPPVLEACFAQPVILAVGRLAPEKAFHLLVQAHVLLGKQGWQGNLCILGEGPERASLEREIARLHAQDTVFLPGFLEPYTAMLKAKVFALSSVFEGASLVIMEAMILGTPVVSTDCPSGPGELLAHGKHGILTPVGNVTALAHALNTMLEPKNNKHYRAQALIRSLDFSLEAPIISWQNLILQVSASKKATAVTP